MKYFLDTEFLEGTQKTWFRQTKPTIDLISIGIVCENGREYYAISKDFNLKEAWNRYDCNIDVITKKEGPRIYWIRDNVLKPIWEELVAKEFKIDFLAELENPFTYKGFKYLINKYGKTNKQIAEEIYEFCSNNYHKGNNLTFRQRKEYPLYNNFKPEFYGYYSDYDWVVFCWLFGKMIDLPKGFPMYCIDLKQWKDQIIERAYNRARNDFEKKIILDMDNMKDYPKQTNEHNALSDAKWNYELYKFLNTL